MSDHSSQAGNRGEGLGRHINRDIRSWAPSLAPITSKGHLCAGPVLASVSEPATAWLVWGLLGIDNEVQERGVALTKHVTPFSTFPRMAATLFYDVPDQLSLFIK